MGLGCEPGSHLIRRRRTATGSERRVLDLQRSLPGRSLRQPPLPPPSPTRECLPPQRRRELVILAPRRADDRAEATELALQVTENPALPVVPRHVALRDVGALVGHTASDPETDDAGNDRRRQATDAA